MNLRIPKNKSDLIYYLHDSLFKNSIYIMLSSISSAGFGLIFWMLAAKFYPPEDVGFAIALISSMSLIVLISSFGLDFSIIRFIPLNDKSNIFNTTVIIMTFFAAIIGIMFITYVDILSPELAFLKSPLNSVLYLMFLVASSIVSLIGITLIAIRKAKYQFIQSIVVGLRVLLLIPLMLLGALGIFSAMGISFILAFALGSILLANSGIRYRFTIDQAFLKKSLSFSAGNYINSIFMSAPIMILPIMVLNILGPKQAAYYYTTYAIVSLLFMIPNAISMSLFVEGSHGEALKKNVIKSIVYTVSLLIPIGMILYLLAGRMLIYIGLNYATHGLDFLKIMIISSLFVGINSIFFALKRIQKDIKSLIILSSLIFVLLLGLSYVFMITFGIVGIGYAWFITYFIVCASIVLIMRKDGWI